MAFEALKLNCLQGTMMRCTELSRDVRNESVNLESLKKKKQLEPWEWLDFGHDFEGRRRLGLETFIYIQQEENGWA